jgi:AcrR family transcriptional regulator
MVDVDVQDRRKTIIEAAMKTFVAYGFKRTTMADIADAAGISRPALYLLFKNKNDIFRAGFTNLVASILERMKEILEGDGPLPDRVADAVVAGLIQPFRDIKDTPHGAELFDAKQELAEDLGADWFEHMGRLITSAMERARAEGELVLPSGTASEAIARMLVFGLEGIKHRTDMGAESEQQMRLLIATVLGPMMTPS